MELVIKVDDDTGQASVTGPIDNLLVAYGLLEIGRDVIQKHNQQQASRIVQPAVLVPQFGKPNGG